MITIGNVYQEGMIDDALKAAADVDTNEIKKAWNDADKGLGDKLKVIDDEGVQKVKHTAEVIDDKIIKPNHADSRSIIARARNSVLQFPIYVSQSIRVNEAHIISKMFERVYTTLVQTVLSQNQYIDEDEANNLVFLKRFHTNLKEAADVVREEYYNKYFEAIDDIDQIMADSVFFTQQLTESVSVEFRWAPVKEDYLFAENARLMNEPLTGLIYLKEAGDDNREQTNETTTKEVNLTEKDLREMAMNEANLTDREREAINQSEKDIKDELEKTMAGKSEYQIRSAYEHRLRQKHDAEKKLESAVDKLKSDIRNGKKKDLYYSNGRFYRKDKTNKGTLRPKDKADPVNAAVDVPKILKDSDIKKINGLLPYTIEATFRIKGKNGSIDRDIRYIIGIKSVLHLIRSQDIADDLRELITGNIKSLQKVRYKTGEIGFMDYMFNIKGLKADAAKHVNYNKRWMNTLKRLSEYDKMNGSLMKKPISAITNGSVPIPNGTLVLSQPDVTMLTNSTGIDISVVSNAKKLAKSLFLIGVVIIDSSAGTMKVLFPDSDSNWDVQSLASIDAELSKTDNSQIMRELNRMVNK